MQNYDNLDRDAYASSKVKNHDHLKLGFCNIDCFTFIGFSKNLTVRGPDVPDSKLSFSQL